MKKKKDLEKKKNEIRIYSLSHFLVKKKKKTERKKRKIVRKLCVNRNKMWINKMKKISKW